MMPRVAVPGAVLLALIVATSCAGEEAQPTGYPTPPTGGGEAGGGEGGDGGEGGEGGNPDDSFRPCEASDHVLYLNGTPNDWVHPGETTLDASFSFHSLSPSDLSARMVPRNDELGTFWGLSLSTGDASRLLTPGRYEPALRHPFNGIQPGLDVHGDARGCNELTGWFELRRLEWVGSDVSAFEAAFEQICDRRGLLRGCARYVRTPGPVGNATWRQGFGDAALQQAVALSVDLLGRIGLAVEIAGEVNFGAGPMPGGADPDLGVASFERSGRILWARRLGDSAAQRPTSIAALPDGGLWVGGVFQGEVVGPGGPLVADADGDGLLLRYGPDGTPLLVQSFAGPGAEDVRGVAVLPEDGAVAAGTFESTLEAGGGPLTSRGAGSRDLFLVALDGDGGVSWQKALAVGPGETRLGGLAPDGSGGFLVGGSFGGSIDLGDGVLSSRSLANGGDAFVARLDRDGNVLFSLQMGGPGGAEVTALAAGPEGEIAIAGHFIGDMTVGPYELVAVDGTTWLPALFFALLGPDGTVRWASSVQQHFESRSVVTAVAVAADGSVIATGNFGGYFLFDPANPFRDVNLSEDLFVVRLAADGAPAGSVHFGGASLTNGGPGDLRAAGMALDPDGSVVLAGSFPGRLELGGSPLRSNGDEDAFLASLPQVR